MSSFLTSIFTDVLLLGVDKWELSTFLVRDIV